MLRLHDERGRERSVLLTNQQKDLEGIRKHESYSGFGYVNITGETGDEG